MVSPVGASPVDLGKQIGSDGATWLNRRLVHGDTADLAPAGFGHRGDRPHAQPGLAGGARDRAAGLGRAGGGGLPNKRCRPFAR